MLFCVSAVNVVSAVNAGQIVILYLHSRVNLEASHTVWFFPDFLCWLFELYHDISRYPINKMVGNIGPTEANVLTKIIFNQTTFYFSYNGQNFFVN